MFTHITHNAVCVHTIQYQCTFNSIYVRIDLTHSQYSHIYTSGRAHVLHIDTMYIYLMSNAMFPETPTYTHIYTSGCVHVSHIETMYIIDLVFNTLISQKMCTYTMVDVRIFHTLTQTALEMYICAHTHTSNAVCVNKQTTRTSTVGYVRTFCDI